MKKTFASGIVRRGQWYRGVGTWTGKLTFSTDAGTYRTLAAGDSPGEALKDFETKGEV